MLISSHWEQIQLNINLVGTEILFSLKLIDPLGWFEKHHIWKHCGRKSSSLETET